MAAMNMVSKGFFGGVSFHLRRCPQGIASVLCKKKPHFWVPMIEVRQPDGKLTDTVGHMLTPDIDKLFQMSLISSISK
jgi:hypothetical protein